MTSVREKLEAKGCHVLVLADGTGLPEALTPVTLAVQGQLLAHRVALARESTPTVRERSRR